MFLLTATEPSFALNYFICALKLSISAWCAFLKATEELEIVPNSIFLIPFQCVS